MISVGHHQHQPSLSPRMPLPMDVSLMAQMIQQQQGGGTRIPLPIPGSATWSSGGADWAGRVMDRDQYGSRSGSDGASPVHSQERERDRDREK